MPPGNDFSTKFLGELVVRTNILSTLRDFGTHTEAFVEVAGEVEVQGLDGDRPTLVFPSVYGRATSAILLAHWVIRTIFNAHGVRDCL